MKFKKFLTAVSACAVATASMAIMAISASAEGLPGDAMVVGMIGTNQQWTADGSDKYPPLSGSIVAKIDGDAQYEATFKVAEAADTVEFLALNISNMTADTYPDLNVVIDKVEIDGSAVSYTMSDGARDLKRYDKNMGWTRIVLTDGWGKDGGFTDVPKATTVTDNVKITFTVSGTGATGTSNVSSSDVTTPTEGPTVTPTTTTPAVTTAANNGGATVTTTIAAGAGSTSGGGNVTSADTGDAGIAIAVAGIFVAGGLAVVTKIKK